MDLNQMMRDPATANCRIYIGNIKDGTTPPEMSAHFTKFGHVLGVILNRGFGFLQFAKEGSASAAIQENGSMFQGRKLTVRAALKDKGKAQMQQQQQQPEVDLSSKAQNPVPQDLNRTARGRPPRSRGGRGGGVVRNSFNEGANQPNGRDRSPMFQAGGGGGGLQDQDQRWGNQNQNNFQPGFGDNGNHPDRYMDSQPGRYPQSNPGPMQHNNAMPHDPMHHQPPHSQATFTGDRNDCEIIVVNKILTQYAEAIEERLKRMGLRVDLLFPNEDVPVSKVLANIAGRGCLYAILIFPINEQHRSITVNVLHGETTEHRNMPVDDALDMINDDFQQAMLSNSRRQQQQQFQQRSHNMPTAVEITPTSSYAAPPLNARHPEALQTLLNLLTDNRAITVLQYDRVIRYLQERRELQLKAEVGDDSPTVVVPSVSKAPATPAIDPEIELKKKIMDILNKPSITTTIPPIVVPKPTPPVPVVATTEQPPLNATSAASASKSGGGSGGSQPPKLLADPKVQKALDSLLSGSLFNF